MAQPNLPAAVVARLIAEHVEEQAINSIFVEGFRQDLESLLAIVSAVDAGRVQAVVDDGLSIGLAEKPLRVGVKHGLPSLAEIEPSDHANLSGVGFPQDIAEQVVAGRQIGTGIVEWNRRRII